MLHSVRQVVDKPQHHHSVVRIGLPYKGPRFLWSRWAANWTWDLQFLAVGKPLPQTPNVAIVRGIHLARPHPLEGAGRWLPGAGCYLNPQVTQPRADKIAHGTHADHVQIRMDPGPADPVTGNPTWEISISFVHNAGDRPPEFGRPRSIWDWFRDLLGWFSRGPAIGTAPEPPPAVRPEEFVDDPERPSDQ